MKKLNNVSIYLAYNIMYIIFFEMIRTPKQNEFMITRIKICSTIFLSHNADETFSIKF
jgi:hypothetical protein